MTRVIELLSNSPLLAVLGLMLVLAVILAPIALRIAGLSAAQIADLLRATMGFVVRVVREIRNDNKSPQ